MNIEEITELFKCAEMNFENLISYDPEVKNHPIFQIAITQLSEAIIALKNYDESEEE